MALCLGGLDPSGGAGLLRDALTLAALGAFPMGICTAETLQNGDGCRAIAAPALDPAECLQVLLPHLGADWGLKLGLCALDPSTLERLAERIREARPRVCIWDPIQAPTSGVGLHSPHELKRMAEMLLPGGAWVVAPNRLEAAAVAGFDPQTSPEALAEPWLELGAQAVWLKGGHAAGNQVEDFWIDAGGSRSLGAHPRLTGGRRGTGCTLASAWLGFRLQGEAGEQAAMLAAQWLRSHWDLAFQPGGLGRPSFLPVRS